MRITKFNSDHDKGYFIRLQRQEALELIASLSKQLSSRNPNDNRLESYSEKGEYFSIAVDEN